MYIPTRGRRLNPPPKKRHPEWLPKPTRVVCILKNKNNISFLNIL